MRYSEMTELTISLTPEALSALDFYIAQIAPGKSREFAAAQAIQEWAAANGHSQDNEEMGLRPEELSAANDD